MKRHVHCTLTLIAFVVLGFSAGGRLASAALPDATYSKDVVPILQKNCVSCHRAGEIGPMALSNYNEVRPWAKSIREIVLQKRMPPWLADPHYSEFSNDRRLSQQEIETITTWVDKGAREGDRKDLPAPLKFEDGWTIGRPDLVLSMTEEFTVPADGVVPYKYFVVPTNFTEDRYIQGAEIRQGNRSVVHHVIVSVREPGRGALPQAGELRIDPRSGASRREAESFGEGVAAAGRNADGMLLGWAPGMPPLNLSEGNAKLVKAGSVLVFQMHYTTFGEAAKDRTSVGFIFSKGPVMKRVITSGAFNTSFAIPPGDPNFEAKSSFVFKEDAHVLSFMPHLHVRGKAFEYRAVYPDGTSKIVLSVPRYDFNWQLSYILKTPLAVPKGTRLECIAVYDNSPGNKFNPDPTKTVRWGDQTWEEMMIGWFDYTLDAQDLRPQTASK